MQWLERLHERWSRFWKGFWQFLNDPEVLRAMNSSGWLFGVPPKDADQPKKPSE